MTKKGKRNVNITNVRLIDTLVILSGDLVQVVAKVRYFCHSFCLFVIPNKNLSDLISFFIHHQGVLLPADGVAGNVAGNDAEAVVGTVSDESPENYPKISIKSALGTRRTNGIRYFVVLYLVLVTTSYFLVILNLAQVKSLTIVLSIVIIVSCFVCTSSC